MKPRLTIVTLGVASMERSKEFYKNALNWEPVDPNDGIAFYAQGGIVFALYPMAGLAEDAMLPPERSGFSGVTLAINLENKEEVDELFRQVVDSGATSLVEPRETFWGGYDCYFADPDGHIWEIAWAPFWKYDEQGSLTM